MRVFSGLIKGTVLRDFYGQKVVWMVGYGPGEEPLMFFFNFLTVSLIFY